MTRTYNINGYGHPIRQGLRAIITAFAAIGGLIFVAASAAFAFMVALSILALGALTFAAFWLRAKVTGRPFGPRAHFARYAKSQTAYFKNASFAPDMDRQNSRQADQDGPVLDAYRTPEGWSVDD